MLQIELVNIGSCAKLLAKLSKRTLCAYSNLILSHRIQPCKLVFNRASLFVSPFQIINVLVINGPSCELFDGNSVRENQYYNVRHFLDGNRINRQRCEYFTLLNIKLARLTSVFYIISLLI